MKKFMMTAVVAFVAAAANAYSIQWGARNMYIPVADNVKVSQSGIVASGGDTFAVSALTVQLYWVNTAGEDVFINSFSTTDAGKIATQSLGDASSSLYSAMVADQGTTWKPTYHFTATYTTADGKYVYSGTSTASKSLANIGAANIASSANFSTAGTWDYTANGPDPQGGPEPTSGLLMLIGMAGLALRRKQK